MGPNRTHIGAITFATEEKIYFTLGQITELESIEKEAGLGLKGAIVGLSLLGGLGAAKGLAPRAAAAMAKSSPAVTARAGDAMKIGLKALKSGKAGVGRFSRQGAEVQKAMGF